MAIDPGEVVQAARDNGEPHLAEWLQAEVDAYHRDKRQGRAKAALGVAAFWVLVIAVIVWAMPT